MSNVTPTLNPNPFPSHRDWLRFWPYEKLSWRQTIANSGLPENVQQLIRTVIGKSRLMRFEKVEVVDELIAHFVDGKMAGKSYAELIASFGDVSITASLIRNSKIRNRPIMFKILQIIGWGTLAIASAYLGLWGYYQSGQPTPTTDFMPAFNEFADNVDEEDQAWPIYRPVWTKYGFSEGGGFRMEGFYVPDGKNEYGQDKTRRITPDDPGWDQITASLDGWHELMECFRNAAEKPRMGLKLQTHYSHYSPEDFVALFPHQPKFDELDQSEYDILANGSIIGILLPHVQSFRKGARLLHFDNTYAMQQNDSERVTRNLIAHFGMARHAADCNCLVGSLVGFAIANMGFEEIERIVGNDGFLNDDQLARIQMAVEKFKTRDLVSLDGERALCHDTIQRVFTDDGNGDGRITPDGLKLLNQVMGMREERWAKSYPEFETLMDVAQTLSQPVAVFVSPTRKETAERYDAIMDLVEEDLDRPAWQAKMHDFHNADEMRRRGLGQLSPLFNLLPANVQIQDRMYMTMATQEATILAIALHRYHLAKGNWPTSSQQLGQDYFVETPIDVFDGSNLRFKIENDSPIVYSVWHDNDDDSGASPTHQSLDNDGNALDPRAIESYEYTRYQKMDVWKYDGDLTLWPIYKSN